MSQIAENCKDFCQTRDELADFRILVGGTERNVPPSFRPVPGFSNDPGGVPS